MKLTMHWTKQRELKCMSPILTQTNIFYKIQKHKIACVVFKWAMIFIQYQ